MIGKKTRCCVAVSVLLLVCMIFGMVACSKEGSLAGEYIGTAGSYLKLDKDGTCIYSEPDATGTGTGTWEVKDNTIYINVSNIRSTIYGNVEDADEGILLQCERSSWNDEYFKRSK